MSARDYTVHVEGVEAFDLSLAALRDLCDVLTAGAERAARLAVEGRSVSRGTAPAWLARAAELRLRRFVAGSLDLGVEARRLVDVEPALFAQQGLFDAGLDPDRTALDLFLDAADDAAAGNRDSDRLDPGILDVLARTEALFGAGATLLRVERAGRSRPVAIDAANAARMRQMAVETPAERITRVRGVLDSLTVSTESMALRLEDGRVLRGHVGALGIAAVREQLGKAVVVEGVTTFRPSGDALRIVAESVWPASDGDVVWAKLPHVEPASTRARSIAPTGGTGLDRFFGTWPGDETDEEIAAALTAFS
ncbi:MAG: hypothetical protein U0234_12480 [Sandaracinus sp.]